MGESQAAARAAQVARTRKSDQRHGAAAELGRAIAHGDRVLVARQSGQMMVEDQYGWLTPLRR